MLSPESMSFTSSGFLILSDPRFILWEDDTQTIRGCSTARPQESGTQSGYRELAADDRDPKGRETGEGQQDGWEAEWLQMPSWTVLR